MTPSKGPETTGIVGAGVTGLVLGYRLARRGEAVTLFEQAPQPGGLATYEEYGDFTWDRFYHVILPSDANLIGLLTELGLGDALFWSTTRTGYYAEGTVHPMNTGLDFLRFPWLGSFDMLRLGAALLYASRVTDWQRLERQSCEQWLVALCGRRVYERFWRPLLRAKLGDWHDKVSAVFIWTYIRRLASARRSGVQRLGHVAGGYKAIIAQLVKGIESAGGRVFCGRGIEHIAPGEDGTLHIHTAAGAECFRRVVFTGPVSSLASAASSTLAATHAGDATYLGIVCLVVVTSKPVCDYYTVNIGDDRLPFTAAIGMSTVVPPEYTGGLYLTYFPRYVSSDDALLSRPDAEVREQFLRGATAMYPALATGIVRSVHVHRARYVQPIQTLDGPAARQRAVSRHPGFHVLNTSQLVDSTLNNNAVVGHVDAFVRGLPPISRDSFA